ncbi:MAG: phosphoethanolamine transferase CptA [Zoogloeaceae bacterium]|jgi:heptose-I-phosphate ethanolaminephosphotransferase|nr:phosphoethanolamine transferase CptA [Zoogloeaceae bacterium]
MSRKDVPWGDIFRLYLFFWYFSGLPQILYLCAGVGEASLLLDTFPLSLVWLAVVLLLPRRAPLVSGVIGLALWSASLVGLSYFGIHGYAITQSVVFAMFESNPEESKEFLSQYFDPWMILGLALYTLCAFLLWRRVRPLALPCVSALTACVSLLAVSLAYPLLARRGADAVTSWQILAGYTQYHRQLAQVRKLLAGEAPPLQDLTDANGDTPRTLVLVVGESTTSQHMSLYGYPRRTSPRLEAMRSSLTVFEDVIAPRPYTIEVLQQALSFAHQEEPRRFPGEPTLLDLMRQAGYKTIWITNQQTMDRVSLLTMFPRQADEAHYLNQQFRQDANQDDAAVLAPFAQALLDPAPKKMIVVHLLGAHLKYQYRYPAAFDRFHGREHTPPGLDDARLTYVNAYDNAVLYNDEIIARLIESFEASQAHGFLLYFSDHGEEVFDTPPHQTLGRNEDAPTPGMYRIPMILWTSPSWQSAHRRDFGAGVKRRYSTTHLIHTWSDLAGLRYDRYRPEWSVANPAFQPFTRWIGNPGGELRDFDATD